MAQVSKVANTAMSWNLSNGYDSDMDIHVFDTLSSLSTAWIHYYDKTDHYCDRSKIFRKVDDGLTVGFEFVRTGGGTTDSVKYAICPAIALMKTYSDSPTFPGASNTFDSETHTEYTHHHSSMGEYIFPSAIGPYPYGTGNTIQMKYTACESKNKKAWTVSILQADKTFEVYQAYIGIDSGGTPYEVLASNADSNSDSPSAMKFAICDENMTSRVFSGSYPSANNSNFQSTQSQIGFGPNSSNLTLIPLINPFTGATCTDLYIAQGGPRDTMIYDITINGRRFVTGASKNTEPNEGMTIESYAPQFKIFMEV